MKTVLPGFIFLLIFAFSAQAQWTSATVNGASVVHFNGNVGIGTTTPGAWFPSVGLDIQGARPTITLKSTSSTGLSTMLFTNSGVSSFNHYGEFHVNYQFVQADPAKSLLRFYAYPGQEMLVLRADGNIGVGTLNPDAKFTVDGNVKCEEVSVEVVQGTAPDYVFQEDYNLLPLKEVEAYINQHKHLPEVPSAKEMEANGLNLKEMNLLLLKKVEELTLHVIELKKENEAIREQISKD